MVQNEKLSVLIYDQQKIDIQFGKQSVAIFSQWNLYETRPFLFAPCREKTNLQTFTITINSNVDI